MSTRPGKRRRDENNCRRKVHYVTFKDAKDRARLVRQLIHEAVLAYRCPLTFGTQGHYHIGHPPEVERLSENDRRGRYGD